MITMGGPTQKVYYVELGSLDYHVLVSLKFKELHTVVWKDRFGEPQTWVKFMRPEDSLC